MYKFIQEISVDLLGDSIHFLIFSQNPQFLLDLSVIKAYRYEKYQRGYEKYIFFCFPVRIFKHKIFELHYSFMFLAYVFLVLRINANLTDIDAKSSHNCKCVGAILW